jgi:hypothetical protein
MPAPIATAVLALGSLHVLCAAAPAAAQEALRLAATARQGGLVTYSAPVNVREHALLRQPATGGRAAGADFTTLRIAGTVRNTGSAPVRIGVLAMPDEEFRAMGTRPAGAARDSLAAVGTAGGRPAFVALFWIDIGPSTSVDLADHAPLDPAALQRMMMEGPVRFGLVAASSRRGRPVRIEAVRSLRPFVSTRSGRVSLVDEGTTAGETWLPGRVIHPGDPYFPITLREARDGGT